MPESVRVDKWLCAVRVYKTRSQATEACKKGHISIKELPVKPSRLIHINEVIKVRKAPIIRSLKIIALAEKRMSAKLITNFMEDVTSQKELELLEIHKNMRWINRENGLGRPTKKDRRELDNFFDI